MRTVKYGTAFSDSLRAYMRKFRIKSRRLSLQCEVHLSTVYAWLACEALPHFSTLDRLLGSVHKEYYRIDLYRAYTSTLNTYRHGYLPPMAPKVGHKRDYNNRKVN